MQHDTQLEEHPAPDVDEPSSAPAPAAQIERLPLSDRAQLARADAIAADWICAHLAEKIASVAASDLPDATAQLTFSKQAREALLSAWKLAAELRGRSVLEEHLIVVFARNLASGLGEKLDPKGDGDATALAAGALVQLSSLDTQQARVPIDTLPASDAVVRWLSSAARLAQAGGSPEIDEAHISAVAHDKSGAAAARAAVAVALRRALDNGHQRSELVRMRRGLTTSGMNLGFFRSETREQFRTLRSSLVALQNRIDAIDNAFDGRLDKHSSSLRPEIEALSTQLDALSSRYEAGVAASTGFFDASPGLAELHTQIDGLASRLPDRAAADMTPDIANLHQELASIRSGLPRPLSALWLMLCVAAAIAVGVIASQVLAH